MRLIDADKLLEEIINQDLVTVFKDGFIKTICNQPTAFDKEKVIDKLEDARLPYSPKFNDINDTIEECIEIVKRGGVDGN